MTRYLQILALSFAATSGAVAFSNTAAAACAGTDTAALVACINALEAKVDSLQGEVSALKAKTDNSATEQKLSALTAQNAQLSARVAAMADSGDSSGDTVKAPFTVTDGAGNPIFKVVSSGGGSAEVTIGSNNQIQLQGSSSGSKITLGNNSGRIGQWYVGPQLSKFFLGTFNTNTVVLQDSGNDGGLVRVKKGAEGAVDLVASGKMTGVTVVTAGAERANLGVPSGKGGAVRIFSGGKQVAAMGSSLDNGGAGAVYIGNGSKNGVNIETDSSSQGVISLFKGGDRPTVQMRGSDTSVTIYGESGTPLGALMESPNSHGGNITLMNSGGQGVVSGGGTTEGDGALCVSRKKNGQTCLGIGLPLR